MLTLALLAMTFAFGCGDDATGASGDAGLDGSMDGLLDDGGTGVILDPSGRPIGADGGYLAPDGAVVAGDDGYAPGLAAGPCEGPDCPTEDDCNSRQAWNGFSCAPCPTCDAEGEKGRWPETTADGYCICETEPGYYYSTGAEVGAFVCDDDGDGWVRESARSSVEADHDPELQANARCDLHRINEVILRAESGDERTVAVVPALNLFETDRNDDDLLLRRTWSDRGFAPYRKDGLPLHASEINGFTKLCHDNLNDYNDNGVPDTEEWNKHALPPNVRVGDLSTLMRFSYFSELYIGSYVPAAASGGVGSYLIAEKRRALVELDSKRVQLDYGPAEGGYWRECKVDPDTALGTLDPPVGLDFAEFYTEGNPWPGMNHHSQFKCFTVSTTPDADNPNAVSKADLGSGEYRLNQCRSAGDPIAQLNDPALTTFSCDVVVPATAVVSRAYWGLVRYEDYREPNEYVRGCINSCVVPDTGCDDVPGPTPGEFIPGCNHDKLDFGKKTGCAEQCDGIDNDDDVRVDEGTAGLACDSIPQGGLTVGEWAMSSCLDGATLCTNGAFGCIPVVTPGQLSETCDGIDNDCNGSVDENITQVGTPCTPGVHPDTGEILAGPCAEGTWVCGEHPDGSGPGLFCQSIIGSNEELPCDNIDNDCNGQTDETRTYFEGSSPTNETRFQTLGDQCTDGLDNNCDGLVDDENGVVEVCANGIDDDCDGDIDEAYPGGTAINVNAGMLCKWPCSGSASRCVKNDYPARVIYDRDATLPVLAGEARFVDLNPKVADFGVWPPFYNKFWKVMQCDAGYWEIDEVCGLSGNATYPDPSGQGSDIVVHTPPADWYTAPAGGTNAALLYCSENYSSTGAGVCIVSDDGDLSDDGAPSKASCNSTSGMACLTCYSSNDMIQNCTDPSVSALP